MTLAVNPLLFAQEVKEIRIVNIENGRAIVDAYFIYGAQKGVSDREGMIRLRYVPGETLFISHVAMGKIALNDRDVAEAFFKGTLALSPGEPVNLEPVTVIGLRPDQRDPLSVRDTDKLSHDAGAVLSRQPAISTIRKSGGYGFDPVLRGFKYEQLQIVVDGLQGSVAACPNRMDPPVSHVALNQVDKIEVHKGPHALRYGPSFGGTINFVSHMPELSDIPEAKGRISTGYESAGNLYSTEAALRLSGRKLAATIKGAWSQGQDYRDGDGVRTPSDFKKGSFSVDGFYQLRQNQSLRFFSARNFARDIDFASLAMDLRSDDTWMFRIDYLLDAPTEKIGSVAASAFATLVDHTMDNLSKPLEPRMMNAATPAQTETYGGKIETKIKAGTGLTHTGIDFRLDQAEGERIREFLMGPNAGKIVKDNVWQDGRISRLGAFVEYRLPTRFFQYMLSGRVDYNRAVTRREADEVVAHYGKTSSTQVNPSFSLGVSKDITESVNAGLWLGRSERSGGMTERYINFFPVGLDAYELVGNPNLKPEVNYEIDLDLKYATEKTQVQASFFSSMLRDFISSRIEPGLQPRLPASPGVRVFENLDKAALRGFELSWIQHWPLRLHHQVEAAYTHGKNVGENEPLPEIPPLDLRVSLSGDLGDFSPEISLRSVLRQNRVSPSYGEMTTPAFTVLDIGVTYKAMAHLKLFAGVENLFDEAYYEHLSRRIPGENRPIYSPGRNFYLALIWSGFEDFSH